MQTALAHADAAFTAEDGAYIPALSDQQFNLEITIPKDNLESLADADWTQYDREVAHDYEGDLDGRIALIPEQYRFNGTVKISYHMHFNED